MPRGNGMGPMGQGPMTGKGMGRCAGANAATDMAPRSPGLGRGRGGGGGGGWRHRHGYNATGLPGWLRGWMGWARPDAAASTVGSQEQELAALKQQASDLGQTLVDLNARIQQLENHETGTNRAPKQEEP
jgi:hypothetical protein